MTDAELTAYLNLLTKLPASLIGVEVRFEKERLLARGQLDLDLLQSELGGVSFGPLFSGRMPVTLRGRLSNDDGFGTLALEEARLGAIPLSPSVLAAMVASATRSSERPNGFDILAPFRYPYGLRAVKLSPGRAPAPAGSAPISQISPVSSDTRRASRRSPAFRDCRMGPCRGNACASRLRIVTS